MTGRQIVTQKPSRCSVCGLEIPPGSMVCLDESMTNIVCFECFDLGEAPMVAPGVQVGVPGRSAAREYHRRRANDAAEARRRLPEQIAVLAGIAIASYFLVQILVMPFVHQSASSNGAGIGHTTYTSSKAHILGVLVAVVVVLAASTKLKVKKQSTEAWAIGARGELAVAAHLAETMAKGVTVIHDRRVPGTRANIDHIAIGPSGIYVIDAKRTTGRVEVRRSGSGRRRGPTQLWVGGRNKSKFLEGMDWQLNAVMSALQRVPEAQLVHTHPMVVLVGAQWGWFARPLQVRGVWVGRAKEAATVVSRPGPVSPEQIKTITNALANAMPPA